MEKEIQPIKEGIRAEEENTEKFVQKLEECQVYIWFRLYVILVLARLLKNKINIWTMIVL